MSEVIDKKRLKIIFELAAGKNKDFIVITIFKTLAFNFKICKKSLTSTDIDFQ